MTSRHASAIQNLETGRYPASFAQRRIWFLHALDPASPLYNIPCAVQRQGQFEVAVFERALDEIVRRHESLRTTFVLDRGEPVQLVSPFRKQHLSVIDLRKVSETQRRLEAQRLAFLEGRTPFDLERGPLLRVSVLQLGEADHLLLFTFHHIVADGGSIVVFFKELESLELAFAKGEPSPLPELDAQYADFASWQRDRLQGLVLEKHLSFWMKQLAGAPAVVELPLDRPRPKLQGFSGATLPVVIEHEILEGLKALCLETGATLFMGLLAAFFSLLYRFTGQTDIVLGTPIALRQLPEFEPLIGLFVNMLVLRADLSDRPTVRDFLCRVRDLTIDAYSHQDLPFERLVEELQPERSQAHQPIVQAVLVLQTAMGDISAFHSEAIEPSPSTPSPAPSVAKFDLTLSLGELGDQLMGGIEFNTDLFDAATILQLIERLKYLLREMVRDPGQCIATLPLLSASEREFMLAGLNATAYDWKVSGTVLDLIWRQRETNPHEIAVVADSGESITYRDFIDRAEAVATALTTWGSMRGELVPVCFHRSLDLLVALAGILRAGAAYVPIDPDQPPARTDFMVRDVAAKVALTSRDLFSRLPSSVKVIAVEDVFPNQSAASPSVAVPFPEPDDLVYAIFTSGSTGQPKCAANNHGALLNRLLWMQQTFGINPGDRVLQKTPYTFDVSVWELFWPLMFGATVVFARPGEHGDAAYLIDVITRRAISVLHFVPSMLRVFLDHPGVGKCTSLRSVIASGEALPADLVGLFYSRLGAELHNLYGPTECAIDVTHWPCRRGLSMPVVPIGHPITNVRIYILDPQTLEPVPPGARGELFIAGTAVGRGYINRPDLTAAAFIPDLLDPTATMYRSGDLARYRADASVEYLGRTDHQIKLRGFRIEAGEVEAALCGVPGVAEAVVTARSTAFGQELVAHCVPDEKAGCVIKTLLRCDRDGLLSGRTVEEIPNGLAVVAYNHSETEFLYREVFVDHSYLRAGVDLRPFDVVLDVGAHIGIFALFVGMNSPGATVYSFEPIPETFKLLTINASLYGWNISPRQAAIGSDAGRARFTYYPNISILSGRYANLEEEQKTVVAYERRRGHVGPELEDLVRSRLESRLVDVPVKTLSQVIAEEKLERIDLLKIDAEKSEMDVLDGIEDEDWPKIQQVAAEVHEIGPRLAHICELLHLKGFDVAVEQESSLAATNISMVFARRASRGASHPIVEAQNLPPSPACLQDQIRAAVARKLPEYMVPSRIIWMECLPRLGSGKIDRKSLPPEPEWQGASFVVPRSEPPRTPVEVRIAQIWKETLQLQNGLSFGRKDSFFALGGHSLLATSVIARVRDAFRVEVSLREFFSNPTVAGLAEVIQSSEAPSQELLDAIPHRNRGPDEVVPLSFSQQRVWFMDQFSPGEATYNIPAVLPLPGVIDQTVLERSLSEIVRRHEILRTCFPYEREQPVQRVSSDWTMRLRHVDVSLMNSTLIDDEVQRLAVREIQRPFDLIHGPLFRGLLIHALDRHFLILTMHHTVSDGWSMGVLFRELSTIYEAFSRGLPSPLPELPIQFADYAIWQRNWMTGEVLERQLSFWKQELAGAPKLLPLPTDRPRPTVMTTRGDVLPFHIDPQVYVGLRALAQIENCTPFMVMLTAFNVLFHRLCGARDICVGAPIANRRRPELESMIGFFVNTIVLRTRWTGDVSFRSLMHMVRDATLAAFANQDMPFEHLVVELEPERAMDRSPIFQVMLILQNIVGWDSTGLVESRPVGTGTAKFDLSMFILPAQTGLVGMLEYRSDLFVRETANCLVQQFCEVLSQAVKSPDAPISLLPLLIPVPRAESALPQIEDDQVAQLDEADPTSIAVLCGSAATTYGELQESSRDLAARLQLLGLRSGDVVAVAIRPCASLLTSLLAIRRSGAAYLLIDPQDPTPRRKLLFESSGARLLLVSGESELASDIPTFNISAAIPQEVALAAGRDRSPHCAVLIRQWSEAGVSIGELSARGLAWRLRFSFVSELAGHRVACAAPPYADAAAYYLATLYHRGCLILPERDASLSPRAFARSLASNEAHALVATPDLLQLLAREFARSIESVELIVSLEDPVQIDYLRAKVPSPLLDRCHFHLGIPAFGVVRVHSESDRNCVLEVESGSLIEVMNEESVAPLGAFGELVLSSLGLARLPGVKMENGAGMPMLRTGVRVMRTVAGKVRVHSHGELFRKAFADVELAISRIVDGAPVVAARDGEASSLIAFTLRRAGVHEAFIQQELALILPASRQPKNIWFSTELPLLPDGEIDIDALIKHGATHAAPYVAPRTDLEQGISRIWMEALGVERVGLHDDFFHLGGHSLLASHVIARIGIVLGVEVPLRTLFEYPTLEGLARVVEQMAKSESGRHELRLERSIVKGPAPLSFAQQRLWFLNRYEPESAFYNVSGAYPLHEPIDRDALERALNLIVARHESLRLSFAITDWEPVQRVEETVHIPLQTIDLRGLPPAAKEAEAERLRNQISKDPFRLEKGPLLRICYIRMDDESSILFLCMHHIVADGWSLGILNRELTIAYLALAAGEPVNLPELPLQYTDYARWQRAWLAGEVLARQLSTWRRMLAGAPPLLQLPSDRPRPPAQGFIGGLESKALDSTLITPLRDLSRSEHATTFMTLFAAYAALLGRYTGQDDIVVGIPIANRRPELAGMIGLVANTLVVRLSLSGSPSFRELLSRTRTVMLESYEHQDTPFEKVVEELQPARDASFNPVFQVMFTHQTAVEADAPNPRETQAAPEMSQTGAAKFDLTMFVMEWPREISMGVEYDAHLFTDETARQFLENYERMLRSVLREPDRSLPDVSLLVSGDIPTPAPASRSTDLLPTAFEALATQHPDRVAIVTRDTELNWRDLWVRSEIWITKLCEEGFDAENPVGILFEDSVDELAAALSLLRAGGTCLFLERRAPLTQIQQELRNTGARVVLSSGANVTPLSEFARVISISAGESPVGRAAALSPSPLAIAIRRGTVNISQAALAASIWAEIEDAGLAEGERTLIAEEGALAFHDALAVWLSGQTVVLATIDELEDVTAFLHLAGCGTTHAYLSPAQFRRFAHSIERPLLGSLEELVVSHPTGLPSELVLKVHDQYGVTVFERLVPASGLPALRRWASTLEPPRALPRPGASIQILDSAGNQVPQGLPGKVCQILPSDFDRETFLTTGVLGRWNADGAVQILCVEAAQVSVRGYPVDCDRVESALRGVFGVDDVAVTVIGPDLVAFIEGNCSEVQAHTVLSQQLPAFMIPTSMVMTLRLPRSGSGEIDRSRLPMIHSLARDHSAGRTPMERCVLNAFAQAFCRSGVGLDDEFLALGGRHGEAYAIAAALTDHLGTQVSSAAVYLYSTPRRLTVALTQVLANDGLEIERLLAELESLDDSIVSSLLSPSAPERLDFPDMGHGK